MHGRQHPSARLRARRHPHPRGPPRRSRPVAAAVACLQRVLWTALGTEGRATGGAGGDGGNLGALLRRRRRSEEHTSELQSLMRISYDVFCLKKKNKAKKNTRT